MTTVSSPVVRVGIGVIICNQEGKVLVGKRKNTHAPFRSIPGGKLDCGETFVQAAIRECAEETNLVLHDPRVIAVTNNLETYAQEGVHHISIIILAHSFSGELCVMEPHKCEERKRVDPANLPMPHFDASRLGIQCYRESVFYCQ